MSNKSEAMEFAEAKSRTDNPSFCLNEIFADSRFSKTTIGSMSSMLKQLIDRGGLVREMKSCPLSKRDHWHYTFNKNPETRSVFRKSISKTILEYAKDKIDLKEPWFCVHEISKVLGIPEVNAKIAVRNLVMRDKISKLDWKHTCKYSDRKHFFYKYFVAGNKPMEEKPIVPEKIVPEKPKKKYKKKHAYKKKYTYKKKATPVPIPKGVFKALEPLESAQKEISTDYKKVEVTIEGGKFIIRAEK